MNIYLTIPEIAVVALGLGLLLLDLWTPPEQKRRLGFVAVVALVAVFVCTFMSPGGTIQFAFGQMYILDDLALFFKRFFLVAAMIVLVMSVEFANRLKSGAVEYYALVVFALAGMMWAASANDFSLLFVAIELITITFYLLAGFERNHLLAIEAGVKYLILGALASAFMVYGIAFVFGSTGSFSFNQIANAAASAYFNPIFVLGFAFVLIGLGFKIAAFPFQVWAPDVYQGAPAPTAAFLAVGSKAAGFVLLLRLLFSVAPDVTSQLRPLLIAIAGLTILYGNLCAIPQRNLKRLLGYSSIANAGYLLLGVVAMSADGSAAILYYLAGYLFAVLAAFTVICLVLTKTGAEDISDLAGLHQRAPLLAAALAMSMVSLTGVPPLAGFIGKFLLLKALLTAGTTYSACYWLVATALVGILISIYYYFKVVRAIYWAKAQAQLDAIEISNPVRFSLYACMVGMVYLGVWPKPFLESAASAARALGF